MSPHPQRRILILTDPSFSSPFPLFIRYDTAAHLAEETHDSHQSTPRAMILPVLMALLLGEFVILGLNAAISVSPNPQPQPQPQPQNQPQN